MASTSCVGDTICAGGIMYAQRTIPALLGFCKDIREVARPGAIFFKLLQPNGNEHLGLQPVRRRADHRPVPRRAGRPLANHALHRNMGPPARPAQGRRNVCNRRDVDINRGGHQPSDLVHQSGLARHRFHPEAAGNVRGASTVFAHRKSPHRRAAAFWVLQHRIQRTPQRIRALVPQTHQAKSASGSTCRSGSTAKPAATCAFAQKVATGLRLDFPNWFENRNRRNSAQLPAAKTRLSYLIEALRTGRPYRGHINVVNQNHITNLPNGCVIEVPAYADRTGINVPVIGALPLACAATCSASVRVQEMAKEAAVHGDVTLPQASSTARSIDWSGLQSRRNLADGRRTAGRASPLAAAIPPRHSGRARPPGARRTQRHAASN